MLIALAFFGDGRHGGNRRRDRLVGLVLIAAGTFNLCVVAPFVGGYFDGRKYLEGMSPSARRGHRGAPQH